MKESKFSVIVVREFRRLSYMSNTLSNRRFKIFRRFFMKRSKKKLDWTEAKREAEFVRFCESFNIILRLNQVNKYISIKEFKKITPGDSLITRFMGKCTVQSVLENNEVVVIFTDGSWKDKEIVIIREQIEKINSN